MRNVECPHCLYVNRVAGLFEAGKAEGAGRIVLYCAFCGQTFTPVEEPDVEGRMAYEHAGTEA
jgi:hypothetical protein